MKRTLIIGAGEAGEMVAREMKNHPEFGYIPVAFVDDDPRKLNKFVLGIKVAGASKDINNIVKSNKIDQILIAIPSAPGYIIRQVIERCAHTKRSFKIVPGIREIITGDVKIHQIKDIEPEDLLGRQTVEIDIEGVGDYLTEKSVLITGAGGSIGREIAKQVSKVFPKILVLFGKGENSIYDTNLEIEKKTKRVNVIGDIRDRNCIARVIKNYRVDIIFHAAAHKHITLMENLPEEAAKNNIMGTKILAEEALKHRVKKFIMISTDKAVNSTSVMGTTKRIAELVILNFALKNSTTRFAIVRFGNVIGSRGSVVPLFKRQILAGGPVTITHPEVTRYFMSISEASLLVIQSGKIARGGEIFILDMGKPVKISALARDMIILSGYESNIDIKIRYIGLMPGEKLSEELMSEREQSQAIKYGHLWIVPRRNIPLECFEEKIKKIKSLAEKGKRRKLICLMTSITKRYG